METADSKILSILENAREKAWEDYRTICHLSGIEMRMFGEIIRAWDFAIELDSVIEWHKGSN